MGDHWHLRASVLTMLLLTMSSIADDHADMAKDFHACLENPKNPKTVFLEWKPPRKRGVMRYLIDYEGRRKVSNAADIEDTVVTDVKKSLSIAKEKRSERISNLVANSVYNFNLSARFIDGLWGPPSQLRLDTSVQTTSLLVMVLASLLSVSVCIILLIATNYAIWRVKKRKLDAQTRLDVCDFADTRGRSNDCYRLEQVSTSQHPVSVSSELEEPHYAHIDNDHYDEVDEGPSGYQTL